MVSNKTKKTGVAQCLNGTMSGWYNVWVAQGLLAHYLRSNPKLQNVCGDFGSHLDTSGQCFVHPLDDRQCRLRPAHGSGGEDTRVLAAAVKPAASKPGLRTCGYLESMLLYPACLGIIEICYFQIC